jgi:hypothetical protein
LVVVLVVVLLLHDPIAVLFLLDTLSFVNKTENKQNQEQAHNEAPHGDHRGDHKAALQNVAPKGGSSSF